MYKRRILDAVVEQLRGLVVVDENSRIVFITQRYADFLRVTPAQAEGIQVKELIPTSRLPQVVASGKPMVGDVFYVDGLPTFCNRYPLIENGKIIGAMSYEVFGQTNDALRLVELVQALQSEVRLYGEELKGTQGAKYGVTDIRGGGVAVAELRKIVLKAASSNATVLIQGETGTGKELVAHSLHAESRRSHFPFVRVNCATIPQELAESELFGYEGGAFTGARRGGRVGKFELAHRGTLFMDEVSQLTPATQAKLLRVLQEKEVDRVGGNAAVRIDTRVVAATNEDLAALVRQGRFREDLFYRLNVIPISVPPLRDRKEDIPEIVRWLLQRTTQESGLRHITITDAAMASLMAYHWPGNVRELQNALERTVSMMESPVLDVASFGWLAQPRHPDEVQSHGLLEGSRADAERETVLRTIRAAKGNMTRAAELLGIDRSWLYRKLHQMGIDVNRIRLPQGEDPLEHNSRT